MPAIASQTIIDPLASFVAGAFVSGNKNPIPLVSTAFEVSIDAGVVTVSTKRIFRNKEADSIEATITFPIPVHATLFSLEAKIDGRVLKAKAHKKVAAREIYEEAIERGKTAALHEEVLRGVHMLSIAQIPAGTEVEVSTIWVTTLSVVSGRGFLRIPLTVGDIYGSSPLLDSDDLIHGGPVQNADLTVRCSSGSVELLHGDLDEGRSKVPLNMPIDLFVSDWVSRDLRGRAADSRDVILRVEPVDEGNQPLNVALLVDHSGSMSEICSVGDQSITKHQAVIRGLKAAANMLREEDVVDVWEFDHHLNYIGSIANGRSDQLKFHTGAQASSGRMLSALADRLSGPRGGTEIGRALKHVVQHSQASDILLITDGKSHALDVQALAKTGNRFNVILVGEDSLEANVGHLAALTDGDIFVTAGNDLGNVLGTAVNAMRVHSERPAPAEDALSQITRKRSGVSISARWQETTDAITSDTMSRAVAALAAGLALPSLSKGRAAALAEAEGLATHLTSLILVDEASAVQDSIPAMRKVPLPTPASANVRTFRSPSPASDVDYLCCLAPRSRPSLASLSDNIRAFVSPIMPRISFPEENAGAASSDFELSEEMAAVLAAEIERPVCVPVCIIDLSGIGSQIDWDSVPNRLIAGDLRGLDPAVAQLIEKAAGLAEVIALANKLNVTAVVLVIGLLARNVSKSNRTAARIAKAILGRKTSSEIEELGSLLALRLRPKRRFRTWS